MADQSDQSDNNQAADVTTAPAPSAAFTPGPWHVDRPRVVYRIRGPQGEFILEGNQYQVTAEANARLIAAAPDLLAAVKLLLKSHDATCPGEACQLYGIDLARHALKKAEGG